MPEVSVIVPVYKVEKYIHRCVDSILGQTFTDFELILVDDGSPDSCPAICDEYATKDSRVHVIHQKNGGLSAARNAGIDWVFDNSASQWLTFIDSDDWVPSRYLELLLDAAKMYAVKISMCWLYYTTGSVTLPDYANLKPVLRNAEQAYTLNGKEIAAFAQGRLYARECFENIRFPIGKLFEDIFTTYKIIFSQQNISVIEAPLYYYYQNQEGIVNSGWTLKKNDLYDAREEQIAFFQSHGFELAHRVQIRQYFNSLHEKLAMASKERKNNQDVIRDLKSRKRRNFPRYIKYLRMDDEADAWVLTKIYPKGMWIYWRLQALKKKLERK